MTELERLQELRELANKRVERAEAKAYAAKQELAEACAAMREAREAVTEWIATHPDSQHEMF